MNSYADLSNKQPQTAGKDCSLRLFEIFKRILWHGNQVGAGFVTVVQEIRA